MRSGGMALNGDLDAFSAISLKLAFSKISNCTFNFIHLFCINILSHFACQVNASSFNKCLDISTGIQLKSSKIIFCYLCLKKS